MLTERMQIQVIADRLAGLPVNVDVRFMTQPWLTCWNAIVSAPHGSEQEALFKATTNLSEQKEILQAILATRPGYVPHVPSLERHRILLAADRVGLERLDSTRTDHGAGSFTRQRQILCGDGLGIPDYS